MVVFVPLEDSVLPEKAELIHAEGVGQNYPNVSQVKFPLCVLHEFPGDHLLLSSDPFHLL